MDIRQNQSPFMQWYNQPADWSGNNDSLTFTVEPGTDYWQVTHYGFKRDNGPFYYQTLEGNFETTVQVTGSYTELYHQAGLMIRLDGQNWIKTGIEFVEGIQNLSAVVTRQFSDWSVVPRGDNPTSVWLKLLRKDDFVEISYSFEGSVYQMLRIAYFPPNEKVWIGMFAAAPGKESFVAGFKNFSVRSVK